jgi:hypothetical protein
MADTTVQGWLDSLGIPCSDYTWLDDHEYERVKTAVRDTFELDSAEPATGSRTLVSKVNIWPLKGDEVKALLNSYVADDQECVYVLWLWLRCGVSMGFASFAANYDDLWYPSRDDVWVANTSLTWCIEITHEEELLLFRAPS